MNLKKKSRNLINRIERQVITSLELQFLSLRLRNLINRIESRAMVIQAELKFYNEMNLINRIERFLFKSKNAVSLRQ